MRAGPSSSHQATIGLCSMPTILSTEPTSSGGTDGTSIGIDGH